MREVITISLPTEAKLQLDQVSKRLQISRSDLIRKAVKTYIAKEEIQRLRKTLVPKARKMGIYTDEDVFKLVS